MLCALLYLERKVISAMTLRCVIFASSHDANLDFFTPNLSRFRAVAEFSTFLATECRKNVTKCRSYRRYRERSKQPRGKFITFFFAFDLAALNKNAPPKIFGYP